MGLIVHGMAKLWIGQHSGLKNNNQVGDKMSEQFTELLLQKKSRRKPKIGDIFALRVKEDLYFYGKVLKTEINNPHPLFQGWNLICVYDFSSQDIINTDLSKLSEHDLLLPPLVTNHKGWYDGYFLTIGNENITEDEMQIDYGFWDDLRKIYRNEEGTILDKKPNLVSRYALVSYGGIGRAIHRVLNKEEHLLL